MISYRGISKFIVSIALILFLVYQFDSVDLKKALLEADVIWVVYGVSLLILSIFLGIICVYLLILNFYKPEFLTFGLRYLYAMSFGFYTPLAVGEFAASAIIFKSTVVQPKVIISLLLFDKLFNAGMNLLFALICVLYFVDHGLWILGGLLIFAVLLLFFFCKFNNLLSKISRRLLGKIKFIEDFAEMMMALARKENKGLLGGYFLTTLIKFCVLSLSSWAFFKCFLSEIPLLETVLICSAVRLVCYIPVSIQGIGLMQLAAAVSFQRIGVGDEVAFLSTTLSQSATFIFFASVICIGLLITAFRKTQRINVIN